MSLTFSVNVIHYIQEGKEWFFALHLFPSSLGDFMSYPTFECYSQLQTLDALRAIFLSALGGFLYGLKLESTTSGNIRWTALIDEAEALRIEPIAKGITGDLLRAYAYE